MMNKMYVLGALVVAIAAAWYVWPVTESGQTPSATPPEVSVISVRPEAVTLTQDLPGRTSAVRIAEIRPQVSGIVTKRLFEEGSEVKEGQQLYQIDPAPYQATYNSTIADLKKAQANVISMESRAQRFAELVKIGGVSKQENDDVIASLAQANADVAIARAAVATAKINLDYTKVMAPISGRIGQSLVTEGALVNANQANAIAVVQQLDNIYVDVSQSSEELLSLRNHAGNESSTPVALLIDGKVTGAPGELKFADVTVNPTTGTVLLRILFPNPDHVILPGLFVQARIQKWRDDNAILVPQKSVSRQADGSVSVWTIDNQNKVQQRPISVTEIVKDQWLVTNGLNPGDKVVLEGVMKIQPDMQVKAVEVQGVSQTTPKQDAANSPKTAE